MPGACGWEKVAGRSKIPYIGEVIYATPTGLYYYGCAPHFTIIEHLRCSIMLGAANLLFFCLAILKFAFNCFIAVTQYYF